MLIVSALGSMPFDTYSLISYGSYVLLNRHSRSFEVSLRLCEDPWPPDIDPPRHVKHGQHLILMNQMLPNSLPRPGVSHSVKERTYRHVCIENTATECHRLVRDRTSLCNVLIERLGKRTPQAWTSEDKRGFNGRSVTNMQREAGC